MLKARDDVVHGLLNALLGLVEILTADTRLFKVGIAVQQLLGGGEIVLKECIGLVGGLRIILNKLEDAARHLLKAVDFRAQLCIINAVIGAANGTETEIVVELTGRRGGHLRLCHRLCADIAAFIILLRRLGREEQHILPVVHIGLRTPHALFHHHLNIPLGLTQPHIGGAGKVSEGDGLTTTRAGHILGKAAGTALHHAATEQQGDTARSQTHREEQFGDKRPQIKVEFHVVAHGGTKPQKSQCQHGDTDSGHNAAALAPVLRRGGDLLFRCSFCLRRLGRSRLRCCLGGGLLPCGGGIRTAGLTVVLGGLFLLGVVHQLGYQEEQAHRPRHDKHKADEKPRTEVAVVLLRLKTALVVVLIAHDLMPPFPFSLRLLPYSSTT